MDTPLSYKIKLFVLKVLGNTTPREEEELDTLFRKNGQYQRLLTDLTNPEEYRSRREQLQLIDTEKELERFLSARQTPARKVRRLYWRVAAVVTPLLVGSVLAWQMLSDTPVSAPLVQSGSVAPGASGAILVLSDGTKQVLSPEAQLFTETNGIPIHIDSNQLNYSTGKITARDTTPIYNHLLVDRGFEYMLVLQDGTKVWLNSASEIHYPVQFSSASRKVRLRGEAYFEVARDTTRPFLVEVNDNFEVKVLGTHFNIKAYPTDDQAETTLLEGKVAVSATTGETIVLSPSQQMIIRKNGEHLVRKVNPEYAIAWHNGWFYFDNETLEKTLEQVGRWYNIDFTFADMECKDIRVSGKVKRFENLQVILDMLKATTKCNYILEKQTIYITKNNRE